MNWNPFTEEHELLRSSVSEFVKNEILPHAEEWEKNHECPRYIFEKMGEKGFFGATYPEEVGGSGMDMWAAVVVGGELAKANVGGLAMSLYAHTYLPLPVINALGTDLQKEKYLRPAIEGKKVGALGVTEPGAGSDVGNIQTTAKDNGDHYLVNGSKMWITNGNIGDFVVMLVRTGEGYQLSLLIVDTDSKGFSAIPVTDKLGMHSSDTSQLFLDDCKVPKENLIGEENFGFYYIMNNFQEERLLAAITATYSAEWALEKAKHYAKEREAFGRQIGKFQVIRHKIAQMAITVEACRSFAFRAVQEFIEHGSEAVKIISMAKAYACEESNKVVDQALQVHGGWGYMEEYGVARAWRDARLMTVGAGTTEIMHEVISKMEVDEVRHEKQFLQARK
jgi:alkylation response protein AidB-like acyl-CoA dehydrogenase